MSALRATILVSPKRCAAATRRGRRSAPSLPPLNTYPLGKRRSVVERTVGSRWLLRLARPARTSPASPQNSERNQPNARDEEQHAHWDQQQYEHRNTERE